MSELPKIWTGEDELFATRLSVIEEACATMKDNEFDSWGRAAYARAMRLLASGGFVEIQTDADGRIIAHMTPDGVTLLDRLAAEDAIRQAPDVRAHGSEGEPEQRPRRRMTAKEISAVSAEIAAMPILDPRSPQEIMDDINEL
jgi:antitoxin VapB